MDYWLCVSVCLCVSVFSRERYNVQNAKAVYTLTILPDARTVREYTLRPLRRVRPVH